MYTYDDFLKAANGAGKLESFSQYDLETAKKSPEFGMSLLGYKNDYANASTEKQRVLANEAANLLRKQYGGYTGGVNGGGYVATTDGGYTGSFGSQTQELMDKVNNYGSFNYGNQDQYQQLLESVVNQQPFSYDESQDPSFSAYKKAYLREGERAAANALAQASAASGGQVSSYAATAAQQANNYYAGQLADVIPTLQQNAYSQYLDELSRKMSQLQAMEGDREFAYQSYLDQYSLLQNALANAQNQEETQYQRYLEQLSQQMQAQQLGQQQRQQEFENALAMYQLLGYATPEIAQVLGLDMGGMNAVGSTGSGDGQYTGEQPNIDPVVIPTMEEPTAVPGEGDANAYAYNDVLNAYIEATNSGASASERNEFLNSAVAANWITQAQAQKIANTYNAPSDKYTAADQIWDRNGYTTKPTASKTFAADDIWNRHS